MKNFKYYFILLVSFLIFGLCSCGNLNNGGNSINFEFISTDEEVFTMKKSFGNALYFNFADEYQFRKFHDMLDEKGLKIKSYYSDKELTNEIRKGEMFTISEINKNFKVYYTTIPQDRVWKPNVTNKLNSLNFEEDFFCSRIITSSGREESYIDYNSTTQIAKGYLFLNYVLIDECKDSEGNFLYSFNFTWDRKTGIITFKKATVDEFKEKGEESGETVVSSVKVTWDQVIADLEKTLNLDSIKNEGIYLDSWTSENDFVVKNFDNITFNIINLMDNTQLTTLKITLPKDTNYIYCLKF